MNCPDCGAEQTVCCRENPLRREETMKLCGEIDDLRRDRDFALRECDRLKAELESAMKLKEMLEVAREMSSVVFVSRDLVERAHQVLGDQSIVMQEGIGRASLLLSEALGKTYVPRELGRDYPGELHALRAAAKKVHAWCNLGGLVEFDAEEQAAWNEAVGR